MQEWPVSQETANAWVNNKKVKLNLVKKRSVHQLGSLAKENLNKFHLKAEIYNIKEIAVVQAGSHLFESALNSPQLSEYTVLAKEHCVLISINVADYQQAIHELRAMYKSRYRLLRRNFLTADEVPLQKISMYFQERRCSGNEFIYHEGDNSDNLYCIASGEIHVCNSALPILFFPTYNSCCKIEINEIRLLEALLICMGTRI